MVTDPQTGTNVNEVADGIYRINTPIVLPGALALNFNQYLLVDGSPLLFHTGPRQLFAQVRRAIESVMPIERLRYVGLSHVEADECGSINQFLAAAPQAQPLCSQVAALVSMNDLADRPPHALAGGERLTHGRIAHAPGAMQRAPIQRVRILGKRGLVRPRRLPSRDCDHSIHLSWARVPGESRVVPVVVVPRAS